MIGWSSVDRRLAVLEKTFLDHQDLCERRADEAVRKADKIETAVGQVDNKIGFASNAIKDRIERMHNENQKWIRTVAAGVIAILLTLLGGLAKIHFNI